MNEISESARIGRVPNCLLPYAETPACVAWCSQGREGERRKVPFAPRTGAPASVSNPSTWGTLAEARRLAFVRAYDGVGIVSAAVPAVVFFDLDRCIDAATGELLNADVARLLAHCEHSYAERTPSGCGARIIGIAPEITATLSRRGTTPGGLALEIYKAAPPYLTVTGQRLGTHPDALADIGDTALDLLPLLGAAGAPEAGGDGREDAEIVRRIVTGEGFHAELCALAARYIGRGLSDAATVETLRGLMQSHPEAARDERWRARFASLPELVASAVQKYADETAPQRRALAKLAGRMIRERRRAAEVRVAIAAEAAALGIDAATAESIARWVAARELAQRGGCHG